MKEHIKGYLFIPQDCGHAPEQILKRGVERISRTHTVSSLYIWREEDEDWLDLPLDQLCRAGRGGIHLHIGQLDCSWQFSPNVGPYHTIRISIYDPFCLQTICEAAIEHFLVQCLAFCEEIHADFACFQHQHTELHRVYHVEELLLALRHHDLPELLTHVWPYSSLYLGPGYVTHETEYLLTQNGQFPSLYKEVAMHRMASGGLFAHSYSQPIEVRT